MSLLAESQASFEHRAKEVGLTQGNVGSLLTQDIKTFNNLAFSVSKQPGQIDDTLFDALLDTTFGAGMTIGLVSAMRQLAYEAMTVSIAAIKQRLEPGDEASPKKLPPQEREERRIRQANRLTGLAITGPLEPSYHLVDLFCQMQEDSCLRYVALSKCTSREQEIASLRSDKQIVTVENAQLCTKSKQAELTADVSTELRVMEAMTRRGLALEQANLMTFETHDMIARSLMKHLSRPVPPGFQGPNIQSVLRADYELWLLVSDTCRASLKRNAAGELPMNEAMLQHYSSAQVVFHMLATPTGRKNPREDHDMSSDDRRGKKRKREKKGKKQDEEVVRKRQPTVPEALKGNTGTDEKGRRICFNYNLAHGCKLTAKGTPLKCPRGLHVCIRKGCHGAHSLVDCDKN